MRAQGQVRACAPDYYRRWRDEAAIQVKEHIEAQGYRAKDLATRNPAIRQGSLEEFLEGKRDFSTRAIAIYAEAAGLELEPPRFSKRADWKPRVRSACCGAYD